MWGEGNHSLSRIRRVTTCGSDPEQQGEEVILLEDMLMWGVRAQERRRRSRIKSLNGMVWQLRWETELRSFMVFLAIFCFFPPPAVKLYLYTLKPFLPLLFITLIYSNL